jgi:radical SAM protein with 4Fe4S-binding SPASM domain
VTKRRAYRRQEPPFNVTLELSRGCNLRCSFCAVAAIQEKQGQGYKFMSEETLTSTVRQVAELGWNCRVGFAMRGEPTMHPEYIKMIRITREHLPRAHITMLTNAGGLVRKPGPVANVTGLFEAGLSVLGLDDYEGIKFVPKTLEALAEHGPLRSGQKHDLGFQFFKYPEDLAGNPHVRRPRGSRTLIQIRDIAAQDADKKIGTHGKLFNYAGLGAAPNDSMAGKRCHHPFRQFVVHWDGNVPLCCNSWDSPYNCGNVNEQSMGDIWQSDAMGAAREMLIRGKREFKPCKGCDHRSYRVGLLPDLLGKGKLRAPDAQTAADLLAALKDGPRDPVVRLPWQEAEKVK